MATLNLSKMKYMSEANLKKFASLIISLSSQVTDVENKCIKPYVGGELYPRDSYVSYNGYIYQATATNQDSAFDETHWDKLSDDFNELTVADIEAMLGLSQEQLETMANLIADTEVRLDKTYSSSKIYQDIQQCLNDSKAFTLLELGKFSGASYKVVASTSEMTSESIIYLLASGNTYDMYIVEEDGTAVKIGNMDVNLDNYFTKAEIENDFLKKVDADGKYATIVTVDGKVDKDKIVTVLDDSVTDEQVPSAKVIYDNAIKDKNIKTYTRLSQLGLTEGSETLSDIATNMSNNSMAILNVQSSCNVSEYPVGYGVLTVNKLNINRVSFIFTETGGASTLRQWFASYNGGKFNGWQRVCTTTVADVPETTVDLTGTDIHGSIKYMVKSGICYVSAWGASSDTVKTAHILVKADVMPKPIIPCGTALVNGDAGQNGKLVGQLYVDYNKALSLHIYSNSLGNVGCGSFSYPVAE